jgi:DNA-binding response OmpR family regulator
MARILLVDDDQNIHRALRGHFDASGHEFVSAPDGKTGLARRLGGLIPSSAPR